MPLSDCLVSLKLVFKVCSRSYSSKAVTTYGSMKHAIVHVSVWDNMDFFIFFIFFCSRIFVLLFLLSVFLMLFVVNTVHIQSDFQVFFAMLKCGNQ